MDEIPGIRGIPLDDAQRSLIAERRKQLGMTQKELGEKIGRKAITIHTIEAGKYLPSPAALSAICEVLSLNCSVAIEVDLRNSKVAAVSQTRATICKIGRRRKSRKGR